MWVVRRSFTVSCLDLVCGKYTCCKVRLDKDQKKKVHVVKDGCNHEFVLCIFRLHPQSKDVEVRIYYFWVSDLSYPVMLPEV